MNPHSSNLVWSDFRFSGYAQITDIVPSLSDSQVVGNSGTVQDALASLLPAGQDFYVNAQSGDISYLFEYSPDSASDNAIYHFSANSQGSCLTYSKSEDGLLDSKGRFINQPMTYKEMKMSSVQELHATQVFPRCVSALMTQQTAILRRSVGTAPQTIV